MDYISSSKIERQELTKWFNHYGKNKSYDYELSPEDGFTKWDAKFYINNKSYLIECKVRDTHYNPLYLEKIKYDALIKYKNDFDDILYFNKTPQGIFIGSISKLIITHIDYVKAPISTVDIKRGYTEKAFIPMYIGEQMKKYNMI